MHINLKTSFMNIVMVFLIFLVMFILTACSGSSEIDIESFKLYTAQSELDSANEIKFEIELSNVGSRSINNFQITHGDESVSCDAETIIGNNSKYYTTLENFTYSSGEKYYLTAIVYDTNKEVKFEKGTFNVCSMPIITNSVAKMEVKTLNLNSYNTTSEEGYKLGDNLTVEAKITNGERYQARYLAYHYELFDGYRTITKTSFLNKNYGSEDTYTLKITLPTLSEINAIGAIELYNESENSFTCKLIIDSIVYGAKNSELNSNKNVSIELTKDLFEISKNTFAPKFTSDQTSYTDVNNNIFVTKGAKFLLVPNSSGDAIRIKYNGNRPEDIDSTMRLTINDYPYEITFSRKANGVFETFNTNILTLFNSNAKGIVISAIEYCNNVTGQWSKIDLGNREIVYENAIAYDYVVTSKEDLFVLDGTNAMMKTGIALNIDNNNNIKCNIILKSDITMTQTEIQRSIFNGSYNLEGRIEGNGKTLTLTTSNPIFNEIHKDGRFSNCIIKGQFTKTESNGSIVDGTQEGFDGLKATAIIAKSNGGTLKNIHFNGNISAQVNDGNTDKNLFVSLIGDNLYETNDILIEPAVFDTNVTSDKYLYCAYHNINHISDEEYHTGEISNIYLNIKYNSKLLYKDNTNYEFSAGSYINDENALEYNLYIGTGKFTIADAREFLLSNIKFNKNSYVDSSVKTQLCEIDKMQEGNLEFWTIEELGILTNNKAWQDYAHNFENGFWEEFIQYFTGVNVDNFMREKVIKTALYFTGFTIENEYINKIAFIDINNVSLENSGFKTIDTGEADAFWKFSQTGSTLTVSFRFKRNTN